MVKSRKSADAEKKFAARKKGGDDDSNSFDDGLAGSESGEETAAMAPDLSMESLRKVFHLPCVDAAVALGVAHSKLKRRCHKLKIARWPQRKLASLVFLRDALPNDPRLSASQREAIIAKIDAEYSKVMLDPNHPLDKELEQLRKSNYKLNYNRKLRCAAKSGKRAGSAGDTETAPSAGGCGSWQGAPDLAAAAGEARSRGGGARLDADGNGGGGRPPRGAPPPLTLGRGSVTSPAGSGQENGAAAATDSPVWDTAGDEEVGAAAAAVACFNNSPRKMVHRRLAAQIGVSAGSGATGGGTGGGGGHPSSLGRRSSLERAALLSVITDGKIVKTGAASRRQSGSGSGNATPRQLQSGGPSGSFGGGGGGGLMAGPGSPLAARRNLASPVGHNAGGGSCSSDLGFHDAPWVGSQNLAAGHLQLEQQQPQEPQQPQPQQPQQLPSLQRPPCGFPIGEETWFQQSSLRGSQHPSHALPDSAVCGAPGAMDALFGGLGGGGATVAAAAAVASQGRGPLPAPAAAPVGGSNSVMSAGVNAILNDTGTGGLLMGLEAMVAGVSGQRPLGPEQLSEEELALLGIQGADRDLLLDPSADNSLDPLLDLLLAGGDALTGAGAAVTGLNRQSSQQQQYAMSVNPSNDVLLPTQQQQQLHSQLDSHRFSSTLVHQQPHPPAPVAPLFASAAFGPARRLSDAMPAADGLFASGGGGGGGGTLVSSLPRTSASGLSLTTSGYGGGGGGGFSSGALGGLGGCIGSGSHSAPLRQHRLSSVSGVSSGMGQRPSRFAGGLDLSMTTLHPLEFNHHRNFVGSCADGSVGNGGGGGVLMGSMLCDDRYSGMCVATDAANGASHSGPVPQLTSRYGAGDNTASAVAITGGLGRRRDFPPGALSSHQQQLSQHANLHPHQHVLNAFEGRHSAPGQFCIPGWDEPPAIAHSGGSGSGNPAVGVDPTTLTGRMLLSTIGPMQQAAEPDLPRLLGTGTATTAAAANAVAATAAVHRLAAALGSDWPLDARPGIGGGGTADCSDSDIARRMAAAHVRSNSTSGLVERDGFPGALSGGAIPAAAAAAACSRPSTGSGYNGAASALSLLNRRDLQLMARDQLTRTILNNSSDNASNNSGNSGGGGGGPAAVAAALGAQGLHMQPQSPLMPSLSDPAPGRGVAGHVSPPPDTIVSLQGLRLRGEDDRIAAGEQRALGNDLLFLRSHAAAGGGGGIGGPGGGNDQLTSMLQELQYLKRQQQQQIQEQAQQIQRQQMQIARLGLLSRLAAYDDPYSLGDTTTTTTAAAAAAAAAEVATVAGKQQQQVPSSLQSHGALAAATAPRQQVQVPYDGNNSVGCDGDGGGGRRSSGLLEAVDLQLTDIDNFMELNVDLLRRNNSGFGSFMNETRAAGLAGGSGGSFTLGGVGNGGGGAGSNDMEVMRQSLRKDLRQNSAEQWEEMLKQLAGGA